MNRAVLLVPLALAACAHAGPNEKGGPTLVPFGPQGLTDAAPRRFALLVGVARFEDERFRPLRYPRDDALALGGALSRAGFDRVRVLSTPEETTRAAVLQALADLAGQVRSPQDQVVLYVSTHGTLAHPPGRALERYLALRDTRMDLVPETGLAVRDLVDRVNAFASKKKAVILATCHSGEGKSGLPDPLVEALARRKAPPPDLLEVSEATLVLSASAFAEAARESPELGHDIYTYFLLEGLQAADRNADGAVTASEAHDYARARTYRFSEGRQRPTLYGSVVGEDPIVLSGARTRDPLPVLYSYSRAADGLSVVVDGETKGSLPGGIAIDPGDHDVSLRDEAQGAELFRGRVTVARGERRDVSSLIPPAASIEVVAEALTWVPLDAAVRSRLFPVLVGGGARLRIAHFGARGLVLEAGVAGGAGAGRLELAGASARQSVTALEADLGVGYEVRWRGFAITPGVAGGLLFARRSLEGDIDRTETLRGATAGLQMVAGYRFAERWSAGARVRAGALFAKLGEDRVHPLLTATAWLSLSL